MKILELIEFLVKITGFSFNFFRFEIFYDFIN